MTGPWHLRGLLSVLLLFPLCAYSKVAMLSLSCFAVLRKWDVLLKVLVCYLISARVTSVRVQQLC